jgi:hypothetical protein
VDIPLSAFSPVDLTDVFQLKFDGNGVIYLDNIYFHKSSGGGEDPTYAAPLPPHAPVDVISIYSDAFTDLEGWYFPDWAQTTQVSTIQLTGNTRAHKMALNSLWDNLYAWRFHSGKMLLMPPITEKSNQSIVTIDPLNTTGQEPITITLDPSLACVPEADVSGLVGAEQIGMHSSAVLAGDPDVTWYNLVPWDGTAYDGSQPILLPNGDGTYSITLTPSEFYGTGDQQVKGISMVFNNSVDWTQSARAESRSTQQAKPRYFRICGISRPVSAGRSSHRCPACRP